MKKCIQCGADRLDTVDMLCLECFSLARRRGENDLEQAIENRNTYAKIVKEAKKRFKKYFLAKKSINATGNYV